MKAAKAIRDVAPEGKLETFKLCWRYYVLPAVVGGVSIASIFGSNRIQSGRIAAVTGLYALSETAFKSYKEEVIKKLGTRKEEEVRASVSERAISERPPNDRETIITGKGEHLCREDLTGRYFYGSLEEVRRVKNDLNEELLIGDTITCNDYYNALGLSSVQHGDDIGWRVERGLLDFEFTTAKSPDGIPCHVIRHRRAPELL